eukprot:4048099-Amphidinium_carterae.1
MIPTSFVWPSKPFAETIGFAMSKQHVLLATSSSSELRSPPNDSTLMSKTQGPRQGYLVACLAFLGFAAPCRALAAVGERIEHPPKPR